MIEEIYNAIKANSGSITFKQLKKKFLLDTVTLENALLELKLTGKILQTSNKYRLFPNNTYIGEITSMTSGNGCVFYDGRRIPISVSFFDGLLLYDVVTFTLNEKNEAIVTSIVDRRLTDVTCEIVLDGGRKKPVCYHKGIHVTLPDEVLDKLYEGDVILVNIGITDEDDYCKSTFVKRIGNISDPNMDDITIAINYGFDNDYSDEYLEELKKIPTSVSDEEIAKRKDFRDLLTCTIDGADTKDMDDGCSAVRLDDNIIRVYIHIASPDYYIKPGSAIFKRAYEKSTSLYTNNSVFHMFHYVLSNGICSLNPHEDRITKTVIIDVNQNGEIINSDICLSTIRSDKKMSYDNIDKILIDKIVPEGYENFTDLIGALNEAAVRIKGNLLGRGKLNFAGDELDKTYNKNGDVISVKARESSPARELIEYLMVAANMTVADYVFYSSLPGVYRIHEIPDLQKVNRAIKIMKDLDFKISYVNTVDDPRVIQKILNRLVTDDRYPILSNILLQFMQEAIYSTDNAGHYALGIGTYTHFTSPIRRFPDFMVHMIVSLLVENSEKLNEINFDNMESQLKEACEHASMMERQSEAAERDAEKLAIVKSMKNFTGSEYTGYVLMVSSNIKVRVNGIDTFVDKNCLASNFQYNRNKKLYQDTFTGKYLNIGQKVTVILNRVDISNRKINITILAADNDKILKKK